MNGFSPALDIRTSFMKDEVTCPILTDDAGNEFIIFGIGWFTNNDPYGEIETLDILEDVAKDLNLKTTSALYVLKPGDATNFTIEKPSTLASCKIDYLMKVNKNE